jgi:N-acetylglutamate synthase-like GNAT family acetyltransferase
VTDLSVRRARPEDADDVFRLLVDFATSYRPEREAFDAAYPALLCDDNADLLVADNQSVVGYALAHRMLVLYAGGTVTELQELMVDPAHRGRGAGRALVAAIVERAQRAGSREVTVPTRRARDFYAALGFTETAVYLKRPLAG